MKTIELVTLSVPLNLVLSREQLRVIFMYGRIHGIVRRNDYTALTYILLPMTFDLLLVIFSGASASFYAFSVVLSVYSLNQFVRSQTKTSKHGRVFFNYFP